MYLNGSFFSNPYHYRKHVTFGEHGHYVLNITEGDGHTAAECNLSTIVRPVNSNIRKYCVLL